MTEKQFKHENYFDKRKNLKTIFSPQIEIFVPFAQNVDPSRLNMTAKQLTQPIIGPNTDTPFVIDKEYKKLTSINSPYLEVAEDDGIIIFNQDDFIVFYYQNQKKMLSRHLPKMKRMVNNSLSLKYRIKSNKFKKGDLLWDYTNVDKDTLMPRIGYRAKVMYAQWFGYNADDAVVISESFAKRTQIEYSNKFYIPITKKWKYFRNIVRDEEDFYFPKVGDILDEKIIEYNEIDMSQHFASEISNFGDEKSRFFTKSILGIQDGEVTSVKVHSVKPIESIEEIDEIESKYIYNKGMISELKDYLIDQYQLKEKLFKKYLNLGMTDDKAKEYTDLNFEQFVMMEKIPKHYETLLRDNFNLENKDIDFLVEIEMKYTVRSTRGDKYTNLFAGKATNAMIINDDLMPKDENGEPVDVIFNTLGIPGRNNWGTIFESLLAKIIIDVERNVDDQRKLKARIKFINENLIKKYDEEYYNQVNSLLENFKDNYEMLKNDIKLKGFYLYYPNFHNIKYKDFYREFAKPYAEKFNVNIGKSKVKITEDFMKVFREKWNFVEPFTVNKETEIQATISYNYFLKLYHTSDSKFNATSFTNSYSKITGQPTRGRKKGGGQHLSWQSLAALLGHTENSQILKEFYTIKSDSLDEKELFIMKYLKDGKYFLKPKYNSITKKTLNNALKLFGMGFDDNIEEEIQKAKLSLDDVDDFN